jgi:hydrogenase maturation factor/predicted fused transcriptional regulator/phosphomethylpyrimidine kinase
MPAKGGKASKAIRPGCVWLFYLQKIKGGNAKMIGKVNDDFFQKNIIASIGSQNPAVVIGPAMGVDSAILKVRDGYMAIAEDPIFPSMSMSPEDFAFLAVHIGASDVAVMGIKPQYMTYSLLLPPGTAEEYTGSLISNISKYAAELGISIVGGHTGFYGAVTIPTIGGITVWGNGSSYISPQGARENDNIIMTKGAAIEAAALLAYELKDSLINILPADILKRSLARLREISVVQDALIAAQNSGVHAMHDATEGGLKRGLWEIAQAAAKGIQIEKDDILIPEDIQALCRYFELEPWEVISEGTLILTCSEEKTRELLAAYRSAGIQTQIIGKVTSPEKGCVFQDSGKNFPLIPPLKDKFWDVFFHSTAMIRDQSRSNEEIAAQRLCGELQNMVETLCQKNIYQLLPEIGANIAYAAENSKRLDELAGIPGRIIRVKGKTVSVSEPEMGASTYMGSSLLTVRKYFPAASCIMNLKHNQKIIRACRKGNYNIARMPVPDGYLQSDSDFSGDLESVLQNLTDLPDIIEIPDRLNLEKLILVLGTSLEELTAKILQINQELDGHR